MSKNAVINVRIPDDLRDKLRERACADGVSVSEYVRRIITPGAQ